MLAAVGRTLVRVFFRDVVVSGAEHVPPRGPAIFAPNHPNSILDPLFAFTFSPPHRLRFIAKAPLFTVPVLGFLLRRLGAIPVVRRLEAAGEVDYTAFFAACVEALARGDSLLVFPEGRSLPQPAIAPLKTGVARLQLLARARGIDAPIVPLGLNYESPWTFRSSVLVAVGEPLRGDSGTADLAVAVLDLTAELGARLDALVFQGESYRDRELMILLERLDAADAESASWPGRVERLKRFERGLRRLRNTCPDEIDDLRRLLVAYERLGAAAMARGPGARDLVLAILGLSPAAVGIALNAVPYLLCDHLVRRRRLDASLRGTIKLTYALILFPLAYTLETVLVGMVAGGLAAALFALLVIPLSLYTLRYRDWRQQLGPLRRRGTADHRRLRARILALVDVLAARPELRAP